MCFLGEASVFYLLCRIILIGMCCFRCSLLKNTQCIDIPQFVHSSVDGHFKLLLVAGEDKENCCEFLVMDVCLACAFIYLGRIQQYGMAMH